MNPIILIPARMASTRLPDKPLAMIGRRADDRAGLAAGDGSAGRGEVAVACDGEAIAQAIKSRG